MTSITIDGVDFACPFWDVVRPHSPLEYDTLEKDILEVRQINYPVLWYLSPRWGNAIVDGMTRASIALKHGLEIPTAFMKLTDVEARSRAEALNVARRHLSLEEQQRAREDRIQRVTLARAENKSIRQIAEAEGVSPMQIRRDLAQASEQQVALPDNVAKPRVRIEQKVFTSCRSLARGVTELLTASAQRRARLRALAHSYGVPLSEDGRSWPAFDQVAAVIRDLNPGAAT